MSEETSQVPPPPAKKSRGWCCSGCLIVVLLLVALTIVGTGYLYHTARTRATSSGPADIPAPAITEEQRQEARDKLQTVTQAIHNEQQETVALTAADLNALIAGETALDSEHDKLVVDMIDNKLIVDFSLPLQNVPGFGGRYFNGSMVARIQVENGVLEAYAEALQLNGRPLPGWMMNSLKERNLADRIYENKNARNALKKIETLTIKDGKMLIETTGK